MRVIFRLCVPLAALLASLLVLAPSRAGTPTFSFSFADSPTQYISYDGGEAFSDFAFTIKGGSGNAGLKPGVAHTISVGSSELSSDSNDDAISAQGTISRTVTIGGISQTLTQTDNLGQGSNSSYTTVDVQAGPTLIFDEGTAGRVDVTASEYTYDTRNGAAPKYQYTLLLRPAAKPVSGISVSPASVTYPASATGTVTLAAPSADTQVVALASSNPAAASVPASLTFTAGQQTLTFPITTARVDKDTNLTLSAAAGGTTKSTAFTVKTRPETAFTYSLGDFLNTDYEGGKLTFGIKGGSGTVKLAQGFPLTVTVGTYYHDFSIDVTDDYAYINNVPVSHACTVGLSGNDVTQTLAQSLDMYASSDDFADAQFSTDVTDSQTVVYDFGPKGRVQVTAAGIHYYFDNSGNYYFSSTSPAQYTFLLSPPDTPSSLLVSPGKVYGGATTYGRVTLASAAGTGGQTVVLQSSDPAAAAVPGTVVVPAGVKTAVFPITTYTTDEDSPVTLYASSGGKSISVTNALTVLARYEFSGTVKSGSSGLSGVTVNASATGTFTLTSTATPAASIPDNSPAGLSSTIVPKGSGTISGLVVGVDITHPRIGDLRLTLKGPDGTSTVLYDQSGGTQANILASYPVLRTPVGSLTAFNGKTVQGTWTLLVQDLATGNVGTLNFWNLTFTYQGTYVGSGKTASDGTYSVSNLKEGTYTAVPSKSGSAFTPASRSVSVGPNVVDPNPSGVDFAKK